MKTSIYSNGINNPDGGFDNVENTKRAIHFYDGQINGIAEIPLINFDNSSPISDAFGIVL